MKKKIPVPKPIISIGKIRRVTDKLLDLGLIWSELKTDKYFYGLIIPKRSVVKAIELFVNKKMEKNKWQNKNNQQANVGVYWDDIKVYHDGNIYESVFAYTEGILVEKNKNYLLIKIRKLLL